MAIYHCVAKPLSRRTGRNAVERRQESRKAQGFAHGARVGSGLDTELPARRRGRSGDERNPA
jgi:hypothetical protein